MVGINLPSASGLSPWIEMAARTTNTSGGDWECSREQVFRIAEVSSVKGSFQ